MLKVAVEESTGALSRSMLDEIVLDGARRMLAAALEAEAASYVAALSGEVDDRGRRLVVRNGHAEPREIKTGAGAIEIEAPRVNDRRVDADSGSTDAVPEFDRAAVVSHVAEGGGGVAADVSAWDELG